MCHRSPQSLVGSGAALGDGIGRCCCLGRCFDDRQATRAYAHDSLVERFRERNAYKLAGSHLEYSSDPARRTHERFLHEGCEVSIKEVNNAWKPDKGDCVEGGPFAGPQRLGVGRIQPQSFRSFACKSEANRGLVRIWGHEVPLCRDID